MVEQALTPDANFDVDDDESDDEPDFERDEGGLDFDFDLEDKSNEREEAKEEEYDYFLQEAEVDEAGIGQGYHIIDEADLK